MSKRGVHINFNFKAIPTEESKEAILLLATRSLKPKLDEKFGEIRLDAMTNYHVTLGQSAYFVPTPGEIKDSSALKKVAHDDANIERDYDNIHRLLQKNITDHVSIADVQSMHDYQITGLKISENGFVFLRLASNPILQKLTTSYQNASRGTHTRIPNVDLSLVKFYVDNNTVFHLTIGKMVDWPKSRTFEMTLSALTNGLEMYFATSFWNAPSINLSSTTSLNASYKKKGDYVNLRANEITLPTQPVLNQFRSVQISPRQALAAISQFGFTCSFTRIAADQIELSFDSKQDKIDFCNKFKSTFSGHRGSCSYAETDQKTALLDDIAIETLFNHARADSVHAVAVKFARIRV